MRPGRIVLLVLGIVAGLISFGLVAGGSVLVWAHATQRDDTGYYQSSAETLNTASYALTSGQVDLGADLHEGDWVPFEHIGTARVRATSAKEGAVFVGIARDADVARYLGGSNHDEVTDFSTHAADVKYRHHAGEQRPAPPGEQDFWVASASGTGRQAVTWDLKQGSWTVVVMNADASPGVAVRASVGLKTGILLGIGIGLLIAGVLGAAVALVLILLAVRKSGRVQAPPPAGSPESWVPPVPRDVPVS